MVVKYGLTRTRSVRRKDLKEVADKMGVTIADLKGVVDKCAKSVRVGKLLCIALAILVIGTMVWNVWSRIFP
jgi:DNA-binding Xre family transcriptional regulator